MQSEGKESLPSGGLGAEPQKIFQSDVCANVILGIFLHLHERLKNAQLTSSRLQLHLGARNQETSPGSPHMLPMLHANRIIAWKLEQSLRFQYVQ